MYDGELVDSPSAQAGALGRIEGDQLRRAAQQPGSGNGRQRGQHPIVFDDAQPDEPRAVAADWVPRKLFGTSSVTRSPASRAPAARASAKVARPARQTRRRAPPAPERSRRRRPRARSRGPRRRRAGSGRPSRDRADAAAARRRNRSSDRSSVRRLLPHRPVVEGGIEPRPIVERRNPRSQVKRRGFSRSRNCPRATAPICWNASGNQLSKYLANRERAPSLMR